VDTNRRDIAGTAHARSAGSRQVGSAGLTWLRGLSSRVLRTLETAILDFSGCVLVISHDRWFLKAQLYGAMDRIAIHIMAFEGNSDVVWYEGNWQDYEADRKRRLGKAADQLVGIKYRKLTR
jgi:hypothetical protein